MAFETSDEQETLESVRTYYGEVLQSTKDLKTSACCTAEALPPWQRAIVDEIHPEVVDRFYGCGSPIPLALAGATVLDLGCGTGRDCFMLAKLVGERGRVIGVDMTDAQLEVARRHERYHAEKFGYAQPNTRFLQGYIEDLAGAGIESASVDLVVSNCVLNLSPDKPRVWREIARVLKPGGRVAVSDLALLRPLPDSIKADVEALVLRMNRGPEAREQHVRRGMQRMVERRIGKGARAPDLIRVEPGELFPVPRAARQARCVGR